MQDTLKIAVIQSNLIWENPVQNRNNFKEKIMDISEGVDVILLPEMFSSGFTMSPQNVAETMQGETVNMLVDLASKKKAAISGSLVIKENEHYFNRLIFAKPDGSLNTYDKRHTFTLAGEEKVYNKGNDKQIVEFRGWRFCPLICYDLRFPVWSRNAEDYDVLFYVANWPKPRISAWDVLLKARAIENMCYCIGVNRVGLDANNYEYPGHSAVYDGLGECLSNSLENNEHTEIISLSKRHLDLIRQKLKFLVDRDTFTVVK